MRWIALLLSVMLIVVVAPAAVANHCYEETTVDEYTREVTVRMVCPAHDEPADPPPPDPPSNDQGPPTGGGDGGSTGDGAGGSTGGGAGGGDTPQAEPVADKRAAPARTCNDVGDVGVTGAGQTETRADGSTWSNVLRRCDTGGVLTTETYWRCDTGCAAPDPAGGGGAGGGGGGAAAPLPPPTYRTIPELRLEAADKVDPPRPDVRHSFDQPAVTGEVRAIVLAEQWWWVDSPLTPVSTRAEDGPVWVEVTATPGEMTIDPGDGTGLLTCDLPGVAYNLNVSYYDQIPGEPKGACVHVYEQTSEAMTATMTVTWDVSWRGATPAGGGVSGTLGPTTTSESVTFPVREIQSVITASGS